MELKVLIIEDEFDIRDVVGKYLIREGYEIMLANDGIDGLSKYNEFKPHLVILDVMMPGIDGFEVLSEIRLISQVPVIMLTAKQEEIDRLQGFDLGADDYVSKPFSLKELVKRVNVLMIRVYQKQNYGNILVFGDLKLDLEKQELFISDELIEITNKEFRLLEVFFKNIGILLSRDRLLELAFGFDYDGYDRNIDSYIKKLRKKIEQDSRKPEYLKTKYGAGYIFGGNKNDY